MAVEEEKNDKNKVHKDELASPLDQTDQGIEDLDLLMESAGFAPKEEEGFEEAAGRYTEQAGVGLEGYTPDDNLEIQKKLAERLGIDYVDVMSYRPTEELLRIIPRRLITRYQIFPIEIRDSYLRVAFADPYNVMAVQDIQLILDEKGLMLEQCLGDEEDIAKAIERWYTAERHEIMSMLDKIDESVKAQEDQKRKKDKKKGKVNLADVPDEDIGSYARSLENVDVEQNEAPLVRLINLIMQKALKNRASDIHFEPYSDEFRIRFRIDGVLQDIEGPPIKLQNAIISRLKIMSGMDLAERRIPQDGRIQMRMESKEIDFRVNSLPSIWGESIVLRLLDKEGMLRGLEEVGFMPDNIALFKKLIRRPNGIILMTGPTGSGKTTTLYAALKVVNTVDTKIITVENPVEYMIEGINQVQIDENVGLTFSLALRTMLRQAPNVILVGEMRDLETAETGIRAALTGHLVFSTLHTNDAPGAATRLIEMGIKPYLVSSSLQAVIAQRLVRRICSDCKEMYYPPPSYIEEMGMNPDDYRGQPFYQGVGCHSCNFTGYRGRTAIHEVMVITEEIRSLIMKSSSSEKIRRKAREEGMRTLREDGWQKILRGETTIEEIMRVTADEIAL